MVTIFILPPSIRELRKRLERRAQDSKGTIEKRLKNARIEMEHWRVRVRLRAEVVNADDLDETAARPSVRKADRSNRR